MIGKPIFGRAGALRGHLWSLGPAIAHMVAPRAGPFAVPWSTSLRDPVVGDVRLSGWLHPRPETDALVVLLHGLGGSSESHYMIRAARAVDGRGVSSLRFNARGADRRGDDFSHAGLVADLAAAFASPSLAHYKDLYILAYSVGGNLAMRYAATTMDPRIRAIACVCSPLDMLGAATEMDRPSQAIYRTHVLAGLKQVYAAVARRHPRREASLEHALAARTFRQWDERTVVPRFGFSSADDYYVSTSAARSLSAVARPTLMLAAKDDPMVSTRVIRKSLAYAPPCVDLRWVDGGHMGFSPSVDLGFAAPRGLEPQAIAWLFHAR